MRNISYLLLSCLCLLIAISQYAQTTTGTVSAGQQNDEQYRPLIHFSPKAHWMNDPNGLVYNNGIYHLFYQYHPHSSVWGPMHWGHATSRNLIQWQHEPVALFPDSLGMIFSGSAVVDRKNTAGFGSGAQMPLVAIFTQHDDKAEKTGRNDYQTQGLAYSLDNGRTWAKYAGNPVLKNPGMRDFRDPKVMWYEPSAKWIMSLAAGDRIIFYSSQDLKKWNKESEFGQTIGAHGGVWECPDLFTLDYEGKKIWTLIVNINPGGPNKGSATQYFLGQFDGKTFREVDTTTRWIDYGPDEYAGITWENVNNRKLFIGWMSNWLYADKVPTEKWRSAMTIPRELFLAKAGNELRVGSRPLKELAAIEKQDLVVEDIVLSKPYDISAQTSSLHIPGKLELSMQSLKNFSLVFSNDLNEQLIIGFDKVRNQYYIDRTKAGKSDFNSEFAAIHYAPRFAQGNQINMTMIIDVSSIELFADEGVTVMTSIFFPNKPYNKIIIQSKDGAVVEQLVFGGLKTN